jgi:hypothetical protein
VIWCDVSCKFRMSSPCILCLFEMRREETATISDGLGDGDAR